MKLNYRFFDKEDFEGRIITYEFDVPFHKNMDDELKSIYGESLTFIKEINHRDKIIRLHTAFDSGKGTKYVPPRPRKAPRQKLPIRIKNILLDKPKHSFYYVLELENEYEEKLHLIFYEAINQLHIFNDSTVSENGSVSGYRTVIDSKEKRLVSYLGGLKFYPYKYKYLDFTAK